MKELIDRLKARLLAYTILVTDYSVIGSTLIYPIHAGEWSVVSTHEGYLVAASDNEVEGQTLYHAIAYNRINRIEWSE